MAESETSSSVTWQKIAIISAIAVVVLPVLATYAWKTLFPPNYLVFHATPIVQTKGALTGGLLVTNEGYATQHNVAVYLTSRDVDPEHAFVDVTAPESTISDFILPSKPNIPLTKYAKGNGARIPVGAINPGEQVLVTLASLDAGKYTVNTLSLLEVHVQSSEMTALKADGVRRPEFDNSLHAFYMMAAPYFLAFIILVLGIVFIVSIIHEAFFDNYQRKMSRMWRQMDTLQEKYDKEKRYK